MHCLRCPNARLAAENVSEVLSRWKSTTLNNTALGLPAQAEGPGKHATRGLLPPTVQCRSMPESHCDLNGIYVLTTNNQSCINLSSPNTLITCYSS